MKSTKSSHPKTTSRRTRILCLCGYALVPLFFLIFYLLMTKTYEDLLQTNHGSFQTLPEIFSEVYHYIPRLGEFYQRAAMHFTTTQTTLGLDLIFRLLTVAMSAGFIYLTAAFILKRRPKLQAQDLAVYLGVFIAFVGFEMAEVFLYRFSYVHNYILAMLATVAFLLPYRLNSQSRHPLAYLGILILGFLFGISTEVAPIAVTIILIASALYIKIKNKLSLKAFWEKYRLQVVGFIGIMLGFAFFYLGAGLSSRTGGGYGAVYDYVSITEIFSAPVRTIGKLVWHTWFNLRYLIPTVLFMLLILVHEYLRLKKHKANNFILQLCLFAFCALFMGASSLIMLYDDLYPRFMIPVYTAIFMSIGIFIVDNIFSLGKEITKATNISAIVLAGVSCAMIIDITYAMFMYHRAMSPIMDDYISLGVEDDNFILPGFEGPSDMTPSPIFKFSQLTPLNWGPANDYMKYGRKPGNFCYDITSCVIIEE